MTIQSKTNFYARGFVFWILFMGLAVVDGWLRDFLFVPLLGNWWALFLSGVLMVGIFYFGAFLLLKLWGYPEETGPLLRLGLIWAGLTFGFEAILGILFRGLTVLEFITLYHPRDLILKGETITFGLVLIIFSPLVGREILKKTRT